MQSAISHKVCFIILTATILWGFVYFKSITALTHGEQAFADGHVEHAIFYWREARQWWAPGVQPAHTAAERLHTCMTQCPAAQQKRAASHLRAAILSTRWLGIKTDTPILKQANAMLDLGTPTYAPWKKLLAASSLLVWMLLIAHFLSERSKISRNVWAIALIGSTLLWMLCFGWMR